MEIPLTAFSIEQARKIFEGRVGPFLKMALSPEQADAANSFFSRVLDTLLAGLKSQGDTSEMERAKRLLEALERENQYWIDRCAAAEKALKESREKD